jgi:signal transduction histidine kinase
MQRIWKSARWRAVAASLGGAMLLACLSLACFALRTGLPTAGFLLLIVVALISALGDFWSAALLSLIAVICLNYLFVEPIYSFRLEQLVDLVALAAFLTTSITIAWLSARVRRLAEEKLERTREELRRLARVVSLGELAASIAHEVNQPLAGVVSSGNACRRWLTAEPANLERAVQSIDRIIRDANRAAQVVERVRALARNAPPRMDRVDINAAVLEIIALARSELEGGRIALQTELAADLPPIWADRVQLQQVILNLIVNSIEALAEVAVGSRHLYIATGRDPVADEVLTTVRDSGRGLNAEQAERIFDAFYTTKRDGMGMGLAVCRGIIEAHGGRLWAAPNQPLGAVLRFTLPVRPQAAT